MFKILEINLYSKENKICNHIPLDEKLNFIYSKNSTGKTKLVELIDYLLGSSSIVFDPQTFKGIEYAELVANCCYLKRKVLGTETFFKLRENDDYENLTLELYKDKVESIILSGKHFDINMIREISEQDISYRTFSIFYFLSQKYQGVIDKNIFTKQNLPEYYRAKYIFKYMFNKKNYKEIFELKKQIKEDTKTLAKNEIIDDEITMITGLCEKSFIELGIKFDKKNIDKNILSLQEYELGQKKKVNLPKSDYYSLLTILNQVDNKLQYYQDKLSQGNSQKSKNQKKEVLLSSLIKMSSETEYSYIIEPIKETIEQMHLLNNIISIGEYEESISKLKKQRIQLIKDIQVVSENANQEKEYIDKKSIILKTIDYLEKLKRLSHSDSVEIKNRIKENKKRIQNLETITDSEIEDKISEKINYYYSYMRNKNYDFVDKDYSEKGFHLRYNSKKNSVNGYVLENIAGKDVEVVRMIGSMARQTLIQVCVYLSFLEVMALEFNFPIINTVVFDCVSKSFDDDNKLMIYDLLTHFCDINKSYNFIVTTDTMNDSPNRYEMQNGLNPYF